MVFEVRGGEGDEPSTAAAFAADSVRLSARAAALAVGADNFARSAEAIAVAEPERTGALERLTEELRATAEEAARLARDLSKP